MRETTRGGWISLPGSRSREREPRFGVPSVVHHDGGVEEWMSATPPALTPPERHPSGPNPEPTPSGLGPEGWRSSTLAGSCCGGGGGPRGLGPERWRHPFLAEPFNAHGERIIHSGASRSCHRSEIRGDFKTRQVRHDTTRQVQPDTTWAPSKGTPV